LTDVSDLTEAAALAVPDPEAHLGRRAAAWLCLLGPFFFASYGAANWLAAQRTQVGWIVFDWEHSIPFLPWTIVPYWSIDGFYALSLFVCTSRAELDTHAKRLLTVQIGAVVCFILFPLRFTFARPETSGLDGFLFAALTSFDKPFNQAPSLHIALLCVIWVLFARHVPRFVLWPMRLWFAVLALSVLTTYQHHFIDVPTGALLGFLSLWLWPDRAASPFAGARLTGDPRRLRLAARYAGAAAALAVPTFVFGGAALWLLWPALALAMVAANYAVFGAEGFQKSPDGRISLAVFVLLSPYLLGAWINSRAWTRHDAAPAAIRDGVFIGRNPWPRAAGGFAAVVDLCAELPGSRGSRAFPLIDLVAPPPERLAAAAAAIDEGRAPGPVLVCCALGYGRSAAAAAAWLIASGRAATLDEAVAQIRRARPRIVLDDASRAAVAQAAIIEAGRTRR
jgi:membrane-associated phospholipid phosphatase